LNILFLKKLKKNDASNDGFRFNFVSFHFVGSINPTYQPEQTSVDAAFMRSPIKTFEICERQSANLRNGSISQRQGYRRIISGSPSTFHPQAQLDLTKIHCNIYFK
jgi:hypothetical protein